jgi:hypothetical protein
LRFATRCRAMELITILNRCHRFRGFVYQHAYFSADQKRIEVSRAAAQGFGRSLLALPFAGARLRPPRRAALRVHSLVGVSRLPSVHHAARRLSPLWRCRCRRTSKGRRQTHPDQGLHALPSPVGAATVMERDRGRRTTRSANLSMNSKRPGGILPTVESPKWKCS